MYILSLLCLFLVSLNSFADEKQPLDDSAFTDLVSDQLLIRRAGAPRESTLVPQLVREDGRSGAFLLGVSGQVYAPAGRASFINGDSFNVFSPGFRTALMGLFLNRSSLIDFGGGVGLGLESSLAITGYQLNVRTAESAEPIGIRVIQTLAALGPNLEWVLPKTSDRLALGSFARVGVYFSALESDVKLRRRFTETPLGEVGARLRFAFTSWGFIQGEYVFRTLFGTTRGNAVDPHHGVLTLGVIL